MNINASLRTAGLTENESKVYLALLELGPSHAGIISQKTGLHRRVIYDTIEMLIKKGLIGYIKQNNKKLFQASQPERIQEIIQEKQNSINEIMPLMQELFFKTKEKEETNFYKGKNGLKTVFEDQLTENKEILILGASKEAFEILPFYFKWYDIERVKKKIKVKIIASEDLGKKIPLAEIKYLKREYITPMAINIYKGKTAIILWKKEPLAIVIKNKDISDSYKKYFELIWKSAR